MNGVYWGLTALCVMGHNDALTREEMIEFVMSCWDEEAGERPSSYLAYVLLSLLFLLFSHALDLVPYIYSLYNYAGLK